METTADFLRHVLPRTGPYCIATLKGGKPKQFAAEDIGEAAAIAAERDACGEDTFFAVGALIKAKEWDDRFGGYFRTRRTGDNIRAIRAYTMDLDAGNGRAYDTTDEARASLVRLCEQYSLPQPTVVQSGFGLHVYWTLSDEVPAQEWEAHGAQLSSMALAAGVKHDSGRTIDSSSILRVVGTHNFKPEYDKPLVEVLQVGADTDTAAFHALLSTHAAPVAVSTLPGNAPVSFGNNTNRYEPESLDPKMLVQNCQAFRRAIDPANQKQGRAAIPEPAWMNAIMLAVHCKNGRKIAHSISDKDPRYTAAYVDKKFDQLEKDGFGPVTCSVFQKSWQDFDGADVCAGCPSQGKITSPAVVAKYFKVLPPLVVQDVEPDGTVVEREIVPPPEPYTRTEDGIGIKTASNKTGANITEIILPYDMYPVRMQYDEKTMIEDSVGWRVNMPHEGWVDMDVPHVNKMSLTLTLQKRGIHTDDRHTNLIAGFMTSYIRKLQQEIPREMAYTKMGWRKGGFIVGDTLFTKGGGTETHTMSRVLVEATRYGMHVAGELHLWKDAVHMYARPGLEAYRVFLYTAFGSTLYSLTGQGSTCLNASGKGGVGKSTVMDIASAIWGNPKALVLRSATKAAAEINANAMNHLPVMLDEITNRDAKEISDFIFEYSGGKGKLRSQSAGGIRNDTAEWSNICLTNANTDVYATMASVYRESRPHLMRLVQIDFPDETSVSKAEGDTARRLAYENYGHAGRAFAAYIAQHETDIKHRIQRYMAEADRVVGAKSEERFWTAWIAVCRCAAEVAHALGLINGYPISNDIEWLYKQVATLRSSTQTHTEGANELLADFFDMHQYNVLVISAKGSGNIDNVASEPRGELLIRKELDTGVAYISRSAMQIYCVEKNINLMRAVAELRRSNIVTKDNVRKILGQGTKWAGGHVRAIEINLAALGLDEEV